MFISQQYPALGTLTENSASRARFNTLDSSLVLNATSKTAERPAKPRSASASESPIQDSDLLNDPPSIVASPSPSPEEYSTPLLAPPNSTTGSIAIRAMRSMRSVALLASWANGKPTEKENKSTMLAPAQAKDDETKRTKLKGKRKFEFGRDQTVSRLSGGSLEAGVSSGPHPHPPHPHPSTTRKSSVLGLGLPSGFRFGTVRSSSVASSDRISCSSAEDPPSESQGCSSSTVSAAPSLRPGSAMSRISSSSSASVKWVEDRLETVRVACRRERRDEIQRDSTGAPSRAKVPDFLLEKSSHPVSSKSTSPPTLPAIAIEEASVNFARKSEPGATPNKQIRIRPASDQMIGTERFRGMRGVGEGEFPSIHIFISRV